MVPICRATGSTAETVTTQREQSQNLGPGINRSGTSGVFTPFVSAEGKTLYYAARFAAADALPAKPLTYDDVIGKLRSSGNGQGDLYSQPWNADDYR